MNKDYTAVLDDMLTKIGGIVKELVITPGDSQIEIIGVSEWHVRSLDLFCSQNNLSIRYEDGVAIIK